MSIWKEIKEKKCVVLTCKKRCYHGLDTDQKITNGNFRSQAAEFLYDSKRSHMSPDNWENTKKKYHAMRRMIFQGVVSNIWQLLILSFAMKIFSFHFLRENSNLMHGTFEFSRQKRTYFLVLRLGKELPWMLHRGPQKQESQEKAFRDSDQNAL